ncbi:MAG TPA: PDDEXK nuclease domain-containing protein [Ginsengibacter sp.]|nr:PDDEXK nuclease domain-containing protein [Ginsengibacter sp.]
MKAVHTSSLYSEIKNILLEARQSVYRSVNFVMIIAYWKIGKRIVEEEQKGKAKAAYGSALLKELSTQLTADFGKGYSETNLKYFRQFYLTFSSYESSHSLSDKSHITNDQKSHALRGELTWTHYRLLMKVDNVPARNYYLEEAIAQNWSTRALERQINSFYYELIISSKNKKAISAEAKKETDKLPLTPEDFIKDPYVLEFLNLPADSGFYEKDIENAIIQKLQQFMLEMGKGFSFVAQQKRISAEHEHFYVDLVFYNYILKCFVLMDLKLGKLNHQDIGQMDLYVRWFEDNVRTQSDNPTIGIILCSEKNETIVKYSILKGSKQLFTSKYKLYLPTEEEFKKELETEILQLKLKNE